ncbi:hypothetical protein QJQ45_028725, partial [Haematococcus lacustris]
MEGCVVTSMVLVSAMDQFVVRGISAADAAAKRHRELLIHNEQRFQMSLDLHVAVIEKRLPGRPRKLSSFGPSLGRNPVHGWGKGWAHQTGKGGNQAGNY